MAVYLTFQPISQAQNSWFASVRISSLRSSIMAGLGVFGFAMNGMCPSIAAQIAPSVSGYR
jgi:hypothetical protein